MLKTQELEEKLASYKAASDAITSKAEAEGRDVTSEEEADLVAALDGFNATYERLQQINEMERQSALLTKGNGRKSEPTKPADDTEPLSEGYIPAKRFGKGSGANNPRVLKPNWAGTGGFDSMGHFAMHVREACGNGGVPSPQLRTCQEYLASVTTYGNETVGADGGFAVPQDFRTAIMNKVMAEDSLVSRCEQATTTGNNLTWPKDETTPWQTTGGIQAYWDGEAAAATQSKPLLENTTLKLNKIRALVPMTEESLDDAPGLDAYLRLKAPAKIGFKVNLAIVQGTGVGQPLGLLGSPALVSVAKETSQVADTLIGNNIIKMYSRMPAGNRGNAIWLINQDVEPHLLRLSLPGTDNTGNAVTGWGGLTYMPPNGMSSAPFGTLYGRPVIPTQACETLGDKGDIFFVDLSQYLCLLKSGQNPRVETSMHLWFDQDIMAFKFVLRIGGLPLWSSSIAARDGSNTYSPYVTLDERA